MRTGYCKDAKTIAPRVFPPLNAFILCSATWSDLRQPAKFPAPRLPSPPSPREALRCAGAAARCQTELRRWPRAAPCSPARSANYVARAAKIVTLVDLAGHERYFKTTAFGLTGHLPDFAALVVGANAGVVGMCKEHLGVALALKVLCVALGGGALTPVCARSASSSALEACCRATGATARIRASTPAS